jgi:hypothetical protein
MEAARFSKEEEDRRLLPLVVPENANDWQALFTYIRMPQFTFVADT